MGEAIARISLWRTRGAVWLGALFVLVAFVLGDRLRTPGLPDALRLPAWAALPTLVLALALRNNRKGFASWNSLQRVRAGALLFGEAMLWCAVFAAPAFILLPQYADYTPRAQTSELFLAATDARTAIATRAATERTLVRAGEGVRIPPSGKVTATLVATHGPIALYRERFGVLAVLYPRLEAEQVLWTCDVYPEKLSASHCRTDSPAPPPTSGQRKIGGNAASHAAALLAIAGPLKTELAAGAKARGGLRDAAKGRVLQPGDVLDFGLVDSDGPIALYSERHGVFVLLEPEVKAGTLEWRCRAWPRDAATPGCPYPDAPEPTADKDGKR